MRHCVKCGESLQENNKYCPKCGADNNFRIPDSNEIAEQKNHKKISPKDKKISLILSLISLFMAIVPFITLYSCVELQKNPNEETIMASMIGMVLFMLVLDTPFTGIGITLGVISYTKNKNNILSIISMILTILPYAIFFLYVLYVDIFV